MNSKIMIALLFSILSMVHGNRITKQDLQDVLKADQAREAALPGEIKAAQQPIEELKHKIEATNHDSNMTEEQRNILVAEYSERLQQAQDALNVHIQTLRALQALLPDEKKLLIKNAQTKAQPGIAKLEHALAELKDLQKTTISEEQKKIVVHTFQHDIEQHRPAVENLKAQLQQVTSKIPEDQKEVENWYHDYVKPEVHYSGDDWDNRLKQRWHHMEKTGEFGHYRVPAPWYLGYIVDVECQDSQTPGFSTDGQSTEDQNGNKISNYGMWPAFDPRDDSKQVQKDLTRLLADAKFDRSHSGYESSIWDRQVAHRSYCKGIDEQIRQLQERIHNEH